MSPRDRRALIIFGSVAVVAVAAYFLLLKPGGGGGSKPTALATPTTSASSPAPGSCSGTSAAGSARMRRSRSRHRISGGSRRRFGAALPSGGAAPFQLRAQRGAGIICRGETRLDHQGRREGLLARLPDLGIDALF